MWSKGPQLQIHIDCIKINSLSGGLFSPTPLQSSELNKCRLTVVLHFTAPEKWLPSVFALTCPWARHLTAVMKWLCFMVHPASSCNQKYCYWSPQLKTTQMYIHSAVHTPWFSRSQSPPASPWSPHRSWPLFSRGTSRHRSGRWGRSSRRPNPLSRWFWRCGSSAEEGSSSTESRRIHPTSRSPPYRNSRQEDEQGKPDAAAVRRGTVTAVWAGEALTKLQRYELCQYTNKKHTRRTSSI